MSVAALALKNRPFTFVMFVMLLALGVQALMNIPRAEDPIIPIPGFNVVVVYPGAQPKDLERLVIDPLEEKLAELDDIKKLEADINPGVCTLRVEFTPESNADTKYEEVLRQVNATRPDLPHDIARLDVIRFSATNVAILQLALASRSASDDDLRKNAERLEKAIEAVPGIKDVDVLGTQEPTVRVAVDAEKAAALGLSIDEIARAIGADNVAIPSGSVDAGNVRRFAVKTDGELKRPEQLLDTVVRTSAAGVVRLGDVAVVDATHEAPRHITRIDGERAVFVAVMQKEGQNLTRLRANVEEVLAAFTPTLPNDIKLVVGFDQSENVNHRLSGFSRDFLLAIFLVLLTLLPLGLRASSIVMVSIPLSLASGLFALGLLGYSINQLSIVGFVIALGLLVDDSIVVVENIARFQRDGLTRMQAALQGTQQISLAVLGCTATLILAFVPLLFLPGTAGAFIRSLPVTVVVTIVASLVVSLTIIPMLASLLLPKTESHEGNFFLRALQRGLEISYRPILQRSVKRPFVTLAVAAALFAGSVALVPHIGFSLFPKAGIPQFRVTVELADGATLDETDAAVRFVEHDLMGRKNVRHVMANVGRGNPTIYYNVIPRREQSHVGEVFVQLEGEDAGKDSAFFDELRKRYAAVPGARIEVKELEQGPPLDAPIALRLVGDDLDALEKASAMVAHVLETTPGTQYVDDPARKKSTEITLVIDRAQAAQLGVLPVDVSRAARVALSGIEAGSIRDEDGDDRAIIVELSSTSPRDRLARPDMDALARAFVRSQSGALVPLLQLATPVLETSPSTIRHTMRERSVTVTAFTRTGFNTDRVTQAVVAQLPSLSFPAGVRVVVAGEVESRKESFGGVGVAAIIALFGVLAVLILEFKGIRGTLIVLSVVPLGIVGGLLGLFLTGNTLSFTATIGFIALMGIEVKNSILLVDFTNRLREQGVALDDAIQRAGETRFIPILLTTLTALGGLVPLALEGSPLYSPLAIVLMGGLITSTVLTRVVTPVVYKLLAPPVSRG